jgi:3-methyladenine DNA glycosylase/8-oxoguanine DNA glycosylase
MDEHSIAKSSIEQLNTIGLSPQKASLIKKITYAIIDKKINLKKMEKMDNQAIHDVLIEYKYLGE